MNLSDYISNLVYNSKNDIWQTNKNSTDISFPSSGSENTFLIEDTSFWFKHRNNIIQNAFNLYVQDSLKANWNYTFDITFNHSCKHCKPIY